MAGKWITGNITRVKSKSFVLENRKTIRRRKKESKREREREKDGSCLSVGRRDKVPYDKQLVASEEDPLHRECLTRDHTIKVDQLLSPLYKRVINRSS